jgi:6,7-dimethyl-8-ribityllumazine synthase
MAKKTAKNRATSRTKISAAKHTAARGKGGGAGVTRMLIVEARFYDAIADKLLEGARSVLDEANVEYDVVTVPGALEIPAAIVIATDAAPYAGVVALGCVIAGHTYHFEVVSNESARGLMDLALRQRLAIGNGILTVDNEQQALDRLGGAHGHKGADAARAALHMARLKRDLA